MCQSGNRLQQLVVSIKLFGLLGTAFTHVEALDFSNAAACPNRRLCQLARTRCVPRIARSPLVRTSPRDDRRSRAQSQGIGRCER